MRRLALTITVLLLASCRSNPPAPQLPEIVRVPVKTFVALPVELTADCTEVPKRNNSYGEAIRLANSRKDSLDECTKRMREIRALQPKP